MKFDLVNILALLSLVATLVIIYNMVRDYVTEKKRISDIGKQTNDIEKSEYKKILNATYWLEHERQRNQGEHFEDESVYLNRAQTIRTKTSFFSLINN